MPIVLIFENQKIILNGKQNLEKIYKKRNELSTDEIETKSLSIANQCLKLDTY